MINKNSQRLYWGELKIKDFKRKFPFTLNKDLAIDFECSIRTVVRRAREYGLEKDPQWISGIWKERIRIASIVSRCHKRKKEISYLLEYGKKYRYKKGVGNGLTHEQRSEIMRKAWVTRKRNQRRKKRWTADNSSTSQQE